MMLKNCKVSIPDHLDAKMVFMEILWLQEDADVSSFKALVVTTNYKIDM